MSIAENTDLSTAIRILLFDVDETRYESVLTLLGISGDGPFRVDWRQSSEQAGNALLAHVYDVILLDESSDRDQDFCFLRLARSLRPNLPIIVMSDHSEDTGIGIKAIRIGASEYLERSSMTSSHLSRVIRYAIERHRSQELIRQMERYSALGQAATVLTHNMKNILTRMHGGLSLLENRHRSEMSQDMLTIFGILNRSSRELKKLTEKVLSFAQPYHCQFELACPNLLIDEIFETCRLDAQTRGIELVRSQACDPPMIRCDRNALKDMLLNLVSNSMDACHDVAHPRILMETQSMDQRGIRLNICDNGPGIPSDLQKKIFEPFFTTKGAKGHGLGLAIVQKLAEAQAAELKLVSEPGNTKFSLHFSNCESPQPMVLQQA